MHKLLIIYSEILRKHLTAVSEKGSWQELDPKLTNSECFKVRAIFIAAVLFQSKNPGSKFLFVKLKRWLADTFGQRSFFHGLVISASDLRIIFDEHFSQLGDIKEVDITTLYEVLLSFESGSDLSEIKISNSKNYKNKLGTYYTPKVLARFVTELTMDAYFKKRGIASVKRTNADRQTAIETVRKLTFADVSCGAGSFVLEIIDYFDRWLSRMGIEERELSELLQTIALNITAVDVDPIALEVCKLSLLTRVGAPEKYSIASNNFIHGNFLLHTVVEHSSNAKVKIFSEGFIYHEGLAIDLRKLGPFDICLGNPPWEKVRFEEKSFFALHFNAIASDHVKKSRSKKIRSFQTNTSPLVSYFKDVRDQIELAKRSIKKNGFFKSSNKGELNTYSLFAEAANNLSAEYGMVGLVLKSSIVTSPVNKDLFKTLVFSKRLIGIYDFINKRRIFDIDSRERFCVLLLGTQTDRRFSLVMNATSPDDINANATDVDYETLSLINPVTGMLPNVSTQKELALLVKVSKELSSFYLVFSDVKFGRIVHLTLHANFISRKPGIGKLPIYEGKFLHQFDSKYAGFNDVPSYKRYGSKSSALPLTIGNKIKENYFPEARFFIFEQKWRILSKNYDKPFMLAWRSLTSATNSRTCIATILPFRPALQSVQFLTAEEVDLIYLCGLFNSLMFDFLVRVKLNGIDLTKTVINQVPVPVEDSNILEFEGVQQSAEEVIKYLVYLLLREDNSLKLLFKDFKLRHRRHQAMSRKNIIQMIDLIVFDCYGLQPDDLNVVLDNFNHLTSEDIIDYHRKFDALRRNKSVSF